MPSAQGPRVPGSHIPAEMEVELESPRPGLKVQRSTESETASLAATAATADATESESEDLFTDGTDHTAVSRETWKCLICLDELRVTAAAWCPGNQRMTLGCCGEQICRNCLQTAVRSSSSPWNCPCAPHRMTDLDMFAACVSSTDWAAAEQTRLYEALSFRGVRCPRPGCHNVMPESQDIGPSACSLCQAPYCGRCGDNWPSGGAHRRCADIELPVADTAARLAACGREALDAWANNLANGCPFQAACHAIIRALAAQAAALMLLQDEEARLHARLRQGQGQCHVYGAYEARRRPRCRGACRLEFPGFGNAAGLSNQLQATLEAWLAVELQAALRVEAPAVPAEAAEAAEGPEAPEVACRAVEDDFAGVGFWRHRAAALARGTAVAAAEAAEAAEAATAAEAAGRAVQEALAGVGYWQQRAAAAARRTAAAAAEAAEAAGRAVEEDLADVGYRRPTAAAARRLAEADFADWEVGAWQRPQIRPQARQPVEGNCPFQALFESADFRRVSPAFRFVHQDGNRLPENLPRRFPGAWWGWGHPENLPRLPGARDILRQYQQLEELERQEVIKPCPGCQIPTQREGGCNMMRCTRCRVEWCFLCGQRGTCGHGVCNTTPALA